MMISAFFHLPSHDESLTGKNSIIKNFHSEMLDNLYISNFSSPLKVIRNLGVNFLKKEVKTGTSLKFAYISIFFLVLMDELLKLRYSVEWPSETDLKGAILGYLWHFYQISYVLG